MIIPYGIVVDIIHVTDMYEAYGTYVDDKYFDNHDYDDDTDDDTDNNNDHKKDSYTAAGAAPGSRSVRGGRRSYCMFPEESYRSNGALDHFWAGDWPWIVLYIP